MKSKFHKILIVPIVIIIIFLHIVGKRSPDRKQEEQLSNNMLTETISLGRYPSEFELKLLNGETFRLSDHIGRHTIILNFFATWCGPCQQELPEIIQFYKKHQSEGLLFIGIDANEKLETVKTFVAKEQIPFPVGIDEEGKIGNQFRVSAYPTTIFIGADGKISLFETGVITNSEVFLESLFAASQKQLQSGKGISKEKYFAKLKNQPEIAQAEKSGDLQKQETKLNAIAQKVASRFKCLSCEKSILICNCDLCKELRDKLNGMNLNGKSDEEILKEIFLTGGKYDSQGK